MDSTLIIACVGGGTIGYAATCILPMAPIAGFINGALFGLIANKAMMLPCAESWKKVLIATAIIVASIASAALTFLICLTLQIPITFTACLFFPLQASFTFGFALLLIRGTYEIIRIIKPVMNECIDLFL